MQYQFKEKDILTSTEHSYTRDMKNKWWEEKTVDLQDAVGKRYMKAFYTRLKETYGPKPRGVIQLRDHDGTIVLKGNDKILE